MAGAGRRQPSYMANSDWFFPAVRFQLIIGRGEFNRRWAGRQGTASAASLNASLVLGCLLRCLAGWHLASGAADRVTARAAPASASPTQKGKTHYVEEEA